MEHGIINGFSNRDKLIERLVDSYNNKTAPEIILLTGPAGSGKSFVANNVVKKCEKISRMRSYINRERIWKGHYPQRFIFWLQILVIPCS